MKFIIFELNQAYYALPAAQVPKVVPPVPLTPVPFVPEYVDGLVNIFGQVIPQINLALKLGLPSLLLPTQGELLLLVLNESYYTLHVSRVIQMVEIDEHDIFPLYDTSELEIAHESLNLIKGQLLWENYSVLILEATLMGFNVFPTFDLESSGDGSGLLGTVEAIAPIPAAETKKQEQQGTCLVVEVGYERYALHLTDVLEIVEVYDITKLPHAPKEMAGITSIRGHPHLVLSLARLMGNPDDETSYVHSMVIIERDQARLGLLVKKIIGIESFNETAKHDLYDDQTEFKGYLLGKDGSMIGLIQINGLISPQRIAVYRGFMNRKAFYEEEKSDSALSGSFLTFSVGHEFCALPLEFVSRVVEYKANEQINLEGQLASLTGAVQIQGDVIPVTDLRAQMEMPTQVTAYTSYIVVYVESGLWALVVDRVYRVVQIVFNDIKPATNSNTDYVQAIGKLNGKLVSILTLEPLKKQSSHH